MGTTKNREDTKEINFFVTFLFFVVIFFSISCPPSEQKVKMP
jgi:hypothetical protein